MAGPAQSLLSFAVNLFRNQIGLPQQEGDVANTRLTSEALEVSETESRLQAEISYLPHISIKSEWPIFIGEDIGKYRLLFYF